MKTTRNRKKKLVSKQQADRQKNFHLLLQKYKKVIDNDVFDIGYEWYIHFTDRNGSGKHQSLSFNCCTSNIVLASMLFEAMLLPQSIEIQSANLIGFSS